MESLASLASPSRLPLLSGVPSAAGDRPRRPYPPLPTAPRGGRGGRRGRLLVSAASGPGRAGDAAMASRRSKNVLERLNTHGFASVSTSNSSQMSTGTGSVPPMPAPPSFIGSPIFWVGVGVALSAVFSMVTTRVKKYAMQQAFKTMMNQAPPMNGQFNSPALSAGSGSPFPFPVAPQAAPAAPSSFSSSIPKQDTSTPTVTVDVPATEVEATRTSEVVDEAETRQAPKNYAFVDISPEELQQKELQTFEELVDAKSESTVDAEKKVLTNGAAFKPNEGASNEQTQSRMPGPMLSVDALEKMMEDPTVQKMVYPYLPEEMRNPETFKWMLQNPQYRQQLQDMLHNMGGSPEWDSRMMDSLKNFDLSSPEVKQQFQQIGLTPEEVVSRIMANPDVAVAFQKPKVQAAIMDCSQNPLNIAKYQNDKEVMDVFTKISELFPGVTG